MWQKIVAPLGPITNWSRLLIAIGGALKPSTCFYHLISFTWNADGTWKYDLNELEEEYRITVPQADDSNTTIEHLGVDTTSKTLGSMTCPAGCSKGAIVYMQTKSLNWAAVAKEGKLS